MYAGGRTRAVAGESTLDVTFNKKNVTVEFTRVVRRLKKIYRGPQGNLIEVPGSIREVYKILRRVLDTQQKIL